MKFLDYLFYNRRANWTAFYLFAGFALFYGLMNGSYVLYIENNAELLGKYTPFNTTLFPLNLFNFDPSMYYGDNSSSVIHPLISFLAVALAAVAKLLGGNWFFLVLQSLVNAGSVVLAYLFLSQKEDKPTIVPLLFALLFGFSSYLMYTALIPDSYPYVQFVILFSVVYMQYTRERQDVRYVPNALIASINFGLTSTNIVPFAAATFFNMHAWRKANFKKYIGIMALAVLFIAVLTGVQYVAFGGRSWVSNWLLGIQNGGTSYATPFQFAIHWKALNMLTINPMMTPKMHLLDPGMAAFVTDLSRSNPIVVQITGIFILLLALMGFIKGIREREVWTLVPYILFAFLLHVVVGFGLAVFQYDMYLYAGHYLFAFFLLGGGFVISLRPGLGKKAIIGLIMLCVIVSASNNIYRHVETLTTIKQSYDQLEQERSVK
ncbi:DUF6080 domain-containing protein [Paenibacillus sp. 2KB_22]|uniref:DUF6080 domain-containing protein n=1 Tax=Paenibacillus sp. 2KB_22 TaxID=3232978 RepID=UPI003F9BA458